MISKTKEKHKAITLRKKGSSYNEILRLVPVAKSTLSLWLRDVGLAKCQRQKLTEKRKNAQLKAQQACREKRIQITEQIKSQAIKEIGNINKRELWLIGTALYWAEGTKQKETNISEQVSFSNSDPKMIALFLKWLYNIYHLTPNDIKVRLH
ncbi:MAG TPA: hypothetical protein ENI16_00425, partial [Candidatus Portnoybacteria bacterium]|nr:hypothetical protein [Candidatus Portnoybacteria bacterium]